MDQAANVASDGLDERLSALLASWLLHPRVLWGYRRASRFGGSSESRLLGLFAIQAARSMPTSLDVWTRAVASALSLLGAK